ncbi:DNA ligase 1-like [Chenopodium quinoa]|uniref:DNA ligase 1-like n=1 Tax=Chenopodium quinoa TaxID=63459 RepID=UPI000B786DE5|nr:DNA ligase 1-like [Chenopodium quinoa]
MEEKEEETTSSNNGEMEKREKEEDEEEQAWGTLEELLLVCAVNRHGFNSWDSISTELQKRIKHSSLDKNDVVNDAIEGGGEGTVDGSFSSGNCRKKYVHLKRRFEEAAEETVEEAGEEHLVRMVDELRKLRVEELKREVHRHDVSIVSLQLKVKRLEEERESSKVKAEDEDEQQQQQQRQQDDDDEEEEKTVLLSDLRIKPEENATEKGDEPERSSVEKVITADSAENRSSNSTNHPKTDNIKPGNDSKRGEPGAVRVEWKRGEPGGGESNRKVNRLSESLSESRRESTRQQSSDVQSSASLSKKKRRRFRGDSGDELEAEEVSPANKRINAKSQPLIRFLESLRSHKHGSVFQRRLPSQETEKYRNVIRQHMDLDTVQSRLDKGIYCDCHPKFYRDLILTFTNAVLFYRKSTAEHIAAKELRRLVMDEVAQKTRKPKVQPRKSDQEPQNLEPVVKKPRSSTTMVVCRRRISNSMQALSDGMKKADTNHTTSTTNSKNNISSNVVNGREEKVKPDHSQKRINGSNDISSGSLSSKKEKEKKGDKGGGGGDENLKKLLTRERSNLGNGGLRLSNSNGKKIISKEGNKREKMGNVSKDSKQESSEGERAEVMERRKINNADQKQEKGTPTPVLKKQGVAKFLKRMKQNSPSSQEKAKNNDSEEDEEEGGVREKTQVTNNSNARKTGGNLKKNISKDVEVMNTTRRSSGRRGEKEAAASRRGIGRPPKRKAAMMSGSTPDSAKGGRSGGRDGGEKFKKKPRR